MDKYAGPVMLTFLLIIIIIGFIAVVTQPPSRSGPQLQPRETTASPWPRISEAPLGSRTQICHDMGVTAYGMAVLRDQGVPLSTLTAELEQAAAHSPAQQSTLAEARLLARAIYLRHLGSPAYIQGAIEKGCLAGSGY